VKRKGVELGRKSTHYVFRGRGGRMGFKVQKKDKRVHKTGGGPFFPLQRGGGSSKGGRWGKAGNACTAVHEPGGGAREEAMR